MTQIQTTSTQVTTWGRDYIKTLPYDRPRVESVCSHSSIYMMQNYKEQPAFCGLCFFREGWDAELPTQVHLFKTLAENGNPETSPKFIAHLFLIMGLVLPRPDETLFDFQRRRGMIKGQTPRAREQYTRAARGLFPVASSLWDLMGKQPPLGIVLVKAVGGRREDEIARELQLSLVNVHIRMAKAVRTAMRFLGGKGSVDSQTRTDDSWSSQTDRRDESRLASA